MADRVVTQKKTKTRSKKSKVESIKPMEDTGSVLVLILQCETKICDQNILNLKWIFSDHYFTVQVCAIDPPEIPANTRLTRDQYIENYNMKKALVYASNGPYITNTNMEIEPQYWWTKLPCIIIKDSSVSNITPGGEISLSSSNNPMTTNGDGVNVLDIKSNISDAQIVGGIKNRIKTALQKASDADLYFLCKWQDMCDKHKNVEGIDSIDHGSTLKWSVHPSATQAIMYTPTSRDYFTNLLSNTNMSYSSLLNHEIENGNILATVFMPNIIDFDSSLATSNQDYLKLNECAPVQTTTSSSFTPLIWFIVLVVIILLIAWSLMQLGPQPL